jgi:hypothetical protein
LFFEVGFNYGEDAEISALLPIGMKFVKLKEVILNQAVTERSDWNTTPNLYSRLPPPAKTLIVTRIYDSNVSFSYKQTNLFEQLGADVG